jgi:E3 ubiquitin-protein ligase TRIP12
MKHIEPDHGYTKKSEPYQYFIRYITELKPDERTAFLKFLTGSKRLPLGGFKNLQPNLTFVKKAQGIEQGVIERDINLPSCNTCFNYVKCPPYTSYEVLKSKFD